MESVFRSDFLWGGACAANQKRQRTKRRIQTLLSKKEAHPKGYASFFAGGTRPLYPLRLRRLPGPLRVPRQNDLFAMATLHHTDQLAHGGDPQLFFWVQQRFKVVA